MKALRTAKPSVALISRVVGASVTAATIGAGVVAAAPHAAADIIVPPPHGGVTIDYTGQNQTYVVPADVWQLNVAVTGAGGGDGIDYRCGYGYGGAGSRVTASVPVTPGDTLTVFAGEGGHLSGAGGKASADGSVQGGNGGSPDDQALIKFPGSFTSHNGGGGGGSSSLTLNHNGRSDVVLVAGGGGGGGGTGGSDFGTVFLCGGDGGAAGQPPQKGYNGSADRSDTVQRVGGGGGLGGASPTKSGTAGADADFNTDAGGSGGGGAGWNGGAGGTSSAWLRDQDGGGGGGGGASMVAASLTHVSYDTVGGSGSAGSVAISFQPPTQTQVTSNGSKDVGSSQMVTSTAVVSGSDGTGTVAFKQVVRGASIAIASCAQQPLVATGSVFTATCRIPSSTVQGQEIDADYSGDTTHGPSHGTSTVSWIGYTATTTTLTSSVPSPALVGVSVTLTAQTYYLDGGGTLTFFQDGVNIQSCTNLPLQYIHGSTFIATCQLDGIPNGHHTFTATYSGDDFFGASSDSMPFSVNDPLYPLNILGTLPDTAQVGMPYDAQLYGDGSATPSLSVTAGSLPDGLTLDPDGHVSGTPTTVGTFTFVLTASNGSAPDFSRTYTITVSKAPTLTGDAGDALTVGQPYSYQYAVGGDPVPAVTLWSGALPDGLTLSPSGLLTGTPTTPGTYYFILHAVSAGQVAALSDLIRVSAPQLPPTLSGTVPATASLGKAYDFSYAVGGTPVPTVSVTSGALPPGIALSQAGRLSGAPTAVGTYTFTVTADNGNSPAATRTDTIVVTGTAATVSGTPTIASVGEPYRFAFTLGGNPLPTLTRTGATLPDGLTLSPAGVLSGTPSRAGTFTFTVSATNGTGPAVARAVTVVVRPKPTLDIADVWMTEGNSGDRAMTFTVRLSRASSLPVTVWWHTINGTAVAGSDFTNVSATLTFPAGTTSRTVTVWVHGDRTREANEYLWLKLATPTH
ncbi:MAG: hypothetical protein QOJ83_372, partial [Frankiales bacterium]|nr:hypothetical protein [Frankiales bacterium]